MKSLRNSVLTPEQIQFWNDNGYLVIPGLFQLEEVESVNRLIEQGRSDPRSLGNATVDVLHGEHTGKRFRAAEAPVDAFQGPIKINDLFLEKPEVRNLALNERLTAILSDLLDGAPMVCNSLNFLWGSQQPDHIDAWYMPPVVPNTMAVSSICLEDVRPDAGPLVYYPGTHKIKPFVFSTGGLGSVPEEMWLCQTYLEQELRKTHYERCEFLGKAGDVFLWHGQLLHGGSGIQDLAKTRKTLVTHYWRAKDDPRAVKVHPTGYYLQRDHAKN
jgi:ectoine hydroxylase-related dioxygenase (phytanoyl-CoA dioxygenase family)